MRTFVLLFCGLVTLVGQTITSTVSPLTTELAAYLQLDLDQVQTIQQLYADYNSFAAAKNQRIAQVQGEIADETGRSPLDPMALGLRYAEIETIRRELRSQMETVQTQIRALITDAQNAKIKALSDAAGLQTLVYAAAAVHIIMPPTPALAGSVLIRTGDFTSGPASFTYILVPAQMIAYLQLTADQSGKINQFNSDLLKSTQPRDQRIADVQSEIVVETAKSPLDPMALGLRYAEIETIRRQEQSDLEALRTNIRSLLTDSQKVKTVTLESAAKLQALVGQAVCAGLLPSNPIVLIPAGCISPIGVFGVVSVSSLSCGGSFVFDPAPLP